MNGLQRLMLDYFETRAGKISTQPTAWLWPEQTRRKPTLRERYDADMDGRTVRLYSVKATRCPSTKWRGIYPTIWGKIWGKCYTTVPWKDCLQCCSHSIKGRKHYCAELKEIRSNPRPDVNTIVTDMEQEAREIIK